MGVTISTGKCASAFRTVDGKTVYCLFEQTYAKNLRPHTPRWCAVALGSYDNVMRVVFNYAADCAGGSIQTTAGETLPENYISSWKRAIDAPVVQPDQSILLRISKSDYDEIPKRYMDFVRNALCKLGRPSILDEMQGNGLRVSLHSDIDLLLALFGVGTSLMPWRILNRHDAC